MIFKDKALTISVNYYFKIHFANKTETKKLPHTFTAAAVFTDT